MEFTVKEVKSRSETEKLAGLARQEFQYTVAPYVSHAAFEEFEANLNFALNIDSILWFGAYSGNEPAGMCAYSDDTACILLLFTGQDFRGRGCAGALIQEVIKRCTHKGVRVNAYKDSLGFYLKQGFKTVGALTCSEGIPVYPMFRTCD